MEFEESVKKLREHYKRIEAAKRKAILIKPLALKKRKRKAWYELPLIKGLIYGKLPLKLPFDAGLIS